MPRHREPLSVDTVRTLAAAGTLAEFAADPHNRRQLNSAVFTLVRPVLWTQHTRELEIRKGHQSCASSVDKMMPECADKFNDDLEALVEHVLSRATKPIKSLEGWIATCCGHATVDAHRRRRGKRGALQRVRPPNWLTTALDNDSWLTQLAVEILTWVGVPTTNYGDPWPIASWAARYTDIFGEVRKPEAVRADVERVLSVMRTCRPDWYEAYVERPLGRNTFAVATTDQIEGQADRPAQPQEQDAILLDAAAIAIDAIKAGLAEGRDPTEVVRSVVNAIFPKDVPTLSHESFSRRTVAEVLNIVRPDPLQPKE